MNPVVLALGAIFAELSLLAFGGGSSLLPEIQRQLVDVHHWLSAQDFIALYGLAQAAPGPNMMVITLLGWRIGGLPGALVSSLAAFAPSSILTGVTLVVWRRFRDAPWRRIVQAAVVPIAVGLVASSAILITLSADDRLVLAGITAVVALLHLRTRVHPLWLLAGGAIVGVTGLGQL
jgi:chromate transporter